MESARNEGNQLNGSQAKSTSCHLGMEKVDFPLSIIQAAKLLCISIK